MTKEEQEFVRHGLAGASLHGPGVDVAALLALARELREALCYGEWRGCNCRPNLEPAGCSSCWREEAQGHDEGCKVATALARASKVLGD